MLEKRAQDVIRNILSAKLCKSKLENPRTSQRSFALRLGISSGVLSDLLNQKRPITKKMALKLKSNLNLNSEEETQFLKVIDNQKINFKPLPAESYELISNGLHFSILRALELSDAESNENWLSKRLNRTKTEIRSSLNRLFNLELITKKNDLWTTTENNLHTSDHIPSEAIQNNHKQSLDEAKSSLTSDPIDVRDFTSLTFNIDQDYLSDYTDAIRDFRKKILSISKNQNSNEVYKLSIQLFPMTVSVKKGEKGA